MSMQTVDQNVQAIMAVESAWSLPALPDEVKLDIAAQAGTPEAVNEFLTGIETGINRRQREESYTPVSSRVLTEPAPRPDPFPQLRSILNIPDDPNLSVGDQAKWAWDSLRGFDEPTRLAPNTAVSELKRRAVALGYLPETTPINELWDPSLRNISSEMARDDFAAKIAGEKTGGFSVNQVAEFMEDWMTPTGLLRAAIDLDFLPDVGQVASEASGWGDKWRKFWDTKSPKDLVDAVTGPIDDIVVPLVNTALLFTGVGNIALFARGGAVMKASKIWSSIPGGRYARAALITGDRLGDAAQPSLISQGLRRFAQPGLSGAQEAGLVRQAAGGASTAMNAWRNLGITQTLKAGVKEGMRLGLVSNLETTFLPEQQGLVQATTGMQAWVDEAAESPLVWGVGEMLFTPTRMFSPLLPLEETADARAGLAKLVSNEVATMEFEDGVLRYWDTFEPDQLASYENLLSEGYTSQQALATKLMGSPDNVEDLSAFMGWAFMTSALESEAVKTAAARFGDDVEQVWQSAGQAAYHKARNHWRSQIRTVDEDDLHEITMRMAESLATGADDFEDALAVAKAMPESELRAAAREHNLTAERTMRQLLRKSVDRGDLSEYLPRVLERYGSWTEFTEMSGAIDDSVDLLRGATFKPALDARGELTGIMPDQEEIWDEVYSLAGGLSPADKAAVVDEITKAEVGAQGIFAPLAKGIPETGAFTAMRAENATFQDFAEFLARGDALVSMNDTLYNVIHSQNVRNAAESPLLREVAERAGDVAPGIELDRSVRSIVQAYEGYDAATEDIVNLARYMSKNEVGLDKLAAKVGDEIRAFEQSEEWASRFRMGNYQGGGGLQAKLKEGHELSKYFAKEVDLESLGEEGARLARMAEERGYKIVHGVDFLQPGELMGRNGIPQFVELKNRTRWRRSLGNFFGRQESGALGLRASQIRRKAAYEELVAARQKDPSGITLDLASRRSEDLSKIDDDLMDVVRKVHEEAQQQLDQLAGKGIGSKVATRWSLSADGIPYNVADLSNFRFHERFMKEMVGRGYTEAESAAIWRSLKKGRALGFQDRGLVHVEDHLRTQPQLLNAMRLLDSTSIGADLRADTSKLRKAVQTGKFGATQGAVAAAGASAGAQFNEDGSLFSVEGAVGAAAALATGNVAAKGVPGVTPGLISKFEGDWNKYAYLGDNLAYLRDQLRFSLSPIFDLSRFTEAAMLSKIGGEDAYLSLTDTSPKMFRRALRRDLKASKPNMSKLELDQAVTKEWDGYLKAFRQEALTQHGWDQSVVDDLSQWYRSVGVLGFDPSAWMATTFASLQRQNMPASEAYAQVTRMFSYGMTGRSSAELSMNFVFFPFSFTKKTARHGAEFLMNDMSRAALLHDYFKTYEWANERYNLTEEFREHLPFLQRLNRLNVFAYGFSLGEFGGPNRPLIDFLTSNPVFGAFVPHASMIRTADDSRNMQQLFNRLVPVLGDLDSWVEDAARQGDVVEGLFSDRPAMTKDAEARKVQEEWDTFKTETDTFLKANGYEKGWGALRSTSDTALDPIRALVAQKENELYEKSEAWRERRGEMAQWGFDRNFEVKNRLYSGQQKAAQGIMDVDVALLQLELLHERIFSEGGIGQQLGVSKDEPWNLPVDVQLAMRRQAARLVEQVPDFARLYDRFFRRYYGDIEIRIQ